MLLLWGQLLLVLLLAAMQSTPTSASRPLAAISSQAAVDWQPSSPQPDGLPEGHSNDPPATTCEVLYNSPGHQHPWKTPVDAVAALQQHAPGREEVSDQLWKHTQGARQILKATTPEAPPVPVGNMGTPPSEWRDASCLVTIYFGVADVQASRREASVFGVFSIYPAAQPKQVGD
jgi:hypothetical protein